jgi:hypothetical protein
MAGRSSATSSMLASSTRAARRSPSPSGPPSHRTAGSGSNFCRGAARGGSWWWRWLKMLGPNSCPRCRPWRRVVVVAVAQSAARGAARARGSGCGGSKCCPRCRSRRRVVVVAVAQTAARGAARGGAWRWRQWLKLLPEVLPARTCVVVTTPWIMNEYACSVRPSDHAYS